MTALCYCTFVGLLLLLLVPIFTCQYYYHIRILPSHEYLAVAACGASSSELQQRVITKGDLAWVWPGLGPGSLYCGTARVTAQHCFSLHIPIAPAQDARRHSS